MSIYDTMDIAEWEAKRMKTECCGNCKHYQEAYCHLMDELVEPEDNCGCFDGVDVD